MTTFGLKLEAQLQPAPALRLRLSLLCRVCRKDILEETNHPAGLVEVARAVNGTCPACRQSAPACPDRNYRARARRWIARQKREAEAAPEAAEADGDPGKQIPGKSEP
ncbi:MAG: hypothetical protein AB7I33_15000 [Gemmatimonadales bacterium]